ncbi:MAG TPA: ABC transporter substrate-binding protein [Stellaceae bacterium]|nr:ABC transporter substrate-binding protein [Stellaceae bacterium]
MARTAFAQKSERTFRIGQLHASPTSEALRLSAPFMPTLAEQGFVEGRNLIVDTRSAEGQLDRLPALAAELVALKPDLIVALPAPATAAVKALTSDIPIVFCFVNDPIGLHFAASLSRPGGNLTGLTNFSAELAPKRVELLREACPDLHRLAIWQNSTAVNDSIELAGYSRAANVYGLEVLTIDARNPGEYEAAAAQSDQWKADGLCITSNPPAFINRRIIIELAARLGKPTIYWNTIFVEDGGLISYAVDYQDIARRAALYAAKILRGAAPGELPIEQPTKFELAVNQRTAKTLGIVFPRSILFRADEVIE